MPREIVTETCLAPEAIGAKNGSQRAGIVGL
jgi:hypothetical protein